MSSSPRTNSTQHMSKEIEALQHAAQSSATTRSYEQAVRHFKTSGGAIPATPDMVAAYLAAFAGPGHGKLAVATLQHRLVAIHRAHVDAGFVSPVMDRRVKRTMQGIRRTYGVAQRRVRAVVKQDLLEMLVLVERQKPLRAARDAALLLVGFAGAFRRSELVSLRCQDVTEFPGGLEVCIRKSKTDQEGRGRTVFIPQAKGTRCPVNALKTWLDMSGIQSGPIFRAVTRHDTVARGSGLTAQSVALIVKEATRRLKGEQEAALVSSHSLRAGFVTEAATVGLQPFQIREVTGHRSDVTLSKYIRPISKRKIPSLL
jgi:integrase